MLISQPSYYSGQAPLGSWIDLPLVPANYHQSAEALNHPEILQIVSKQYEEKTNTKLIHGRLVSPYTYIMRDGQEIKSIQDLAGKKLRSTGGTMNALLKELGAVPVEITPSEMYTSLQTGVVDGMVLPLYALESYKLGEIAGSVTTAGEGSIAGIQAVFVWMNLDKWNALPKDLQDLIVSTSADDVATQIDFWKQVESEALAYAKERGVKINQLSDTDLEAIRSRSGKIIDAFTDENGQEAARIVELFETSVG